MEEEDDYQSAHNGPAIPPVEEALKGPTLSLDVFLMLCCWKMCSALGMVSHSD